MIINPFTKHKQKALEESYVFILMGNSFPMVDPKKLAPKRMQREWQHHSLVLVLKAKGPNFEHSTNRKAPFRVGGQLLGPSIK